MPDLLQIKEKSVWRLALIGRFTGILVTARFLPMAGDVILTYRKTMYAELTNAAALVKISGTLAETAE